MHKEKFDYADDDFGAVINCAVRYACGRRTYMPHIVAGYILPIVSKLNSRTLAVLDKDLDDIHKLSGFGDPTIDEPIWVKLHEEVKAELGRRNGVIDNS